MLCQGASAGDTNASEKGEQKAALLGSDVQEFVARLDAERKALEDAQLVSKGDAAALDRLRKAAASKDAYAQYQLGLLYREGTGVPKDAVMSSFWFEKSGEQGNVRAQERLIEIYEKGEGVPKNLVTAAAWAGRAADQGDATGVMALTMDYYYGRGVSRDYVQAVKWHAVAVAIGAISDSGKFSEELKRRAGPEQVAQGQALAREWLAASHRAK